MESRLQPVRHPQTRRRQNVSRRYTTRHPGKPKGFQGGEVWSSGFSRSGIRKRDDTMNGSWNGDIAQEFGCWTLPQHPWVRRPRHPNSQAPTGRPRCGECKFPSPEEKEGDNLQGPGKSSNRLLSVVGSV